MDDLLTEFLTETFESLGLLDNEIVKLEETPDDLNLLGNIFRIVHTIKGTCGFLGLHRLEVLAHAAENVLGRIRDHEIPISKDAISCVLEALDAIKAILDHLEQHQKEPKGDDAALIDKLNQIAEGAQLTIAKPHHITHTTAPHITQQSIRVHVDLLENLITLVSELVLTRNQLLQLTRDHKDNGFGLPLQRLNHLTTELQEHVMKTRMQPIGNAWAKLPRMVRDVSEALDKNIKLVLCGEDTELDRQIIELIKDPLTHMIRNAADHGIETKEERLIAGKPEMGTINLTAFHEGGHVFIEIEDDGHGLSLEKIRKKIIQNKLSREDQLDDLTAHEIQQYIFKPGFSTAETVTNISGRGVGMDVVKTNIEKIGGTIEMSSHEGIGTKFTIKIPLTLAIISALIIECKNMRFAMPQINVLELKRIAKHTEHHIEMINNQPVLRLRNLLLPLVSLAEILHLSPCHPEPHSRHPESHPRHPELVSGSSYTTPSLREIPKQVRDDNKGGVRDDKRGDARNDNPPAAPSSLRASASEAKQSSSFPGLLRTSGARNDEVIAENSVIPIVSNTMDWWETRNDIPLPRHPELVSGSHKATKQTYQNESYIIVTQVGNKTFGIIVDKIFDIEEIVVKPVSPLLRSISVFAGNTILGDGSVIMILDPNGIAASFGKVNTHKEPPHKIDVKATETSHEKIPFILFHAGGPTLKALPLELIARLEEFNKSDIEYSDGKAVIQYRDHLMPLIALDTTAETTKDTQAVLVFSEGDHMMGLMVDEILDIVEDYLNVDITIDRPGLIGTAIIHGKSTDIIDASHYITKTHPDWFKSREEACAVTHITPPKLLLIDDSPFFRNLLKPILNIAGYDVDTAETAEQALKMQDDGYNYDTIISDLEMPGMSGFEFAKTIRKVKGKWQNTPIIALSSHTTSKDIDRGHEAGFTAFISKNDKEKLLAVLRASQEPGTRNREPGR